MDRSCIKITAFWAFLTLLLSIAYTSLLVWHSARYGKLLAYPGYDDIFYISDSLDELDKLRSGLTAAVESYIHAPPHSPGQNLLAIAAFATLGVHHWTPYLLDALVVWLLLMLANALLDGVSPGQRAGVFLFVLATPLSSAAVLEFRPDILCAVATAGGILLLCAGSQNRSRPLAAGMLWGLALLFKPSVFPLTLLLAFSALVMQFPFQPRRAKWFASVSTPMMLAALLYYPIAWRQTWQYIHENTVGRYSGIWRPSLNWPERLGYYLTGPGGARLLGGELYPLIAICAAGAVVVLARSLRRRVPAIRILILTLFVLEAYLVPTLNPVKNDFLGATFQMLLLLGAVLAAGGLLRAAAAGGNRPRLIGWTLSLLLAATGAAFGYRFQTLTTGAARQAARDNQTVDGIVAAIRAPARVFVTSEGLVNEHVLNFVAHRKGAGIQFSDLGRDDNLADYHRQFDSSDWVVATEPGNPDYVRYLASGGIQTECLDLLKLLGDFECVDRVGTGYLLFRRTPVRAGY